jgi:hypothetical protein
MYEMSNRLYKTFREFYCIARRPNNSGIPLSEETRIWIEGICQDMLAIPFGVRTSIPSLNKKLSDMIEMGFLKVKGRQISQFDPATRKA